MIATRIIFLLVPVFLSLMHMDAFAATYSHGARAYNDREFVQAYEIWLPLAKRGNPRAQNGIGVLYRHGRGVEPDLTIARYWFAQAAQAGYAVGMFNLGQLYRGHPSRDGDVQRGVELIRRAADAGYAKAQFTIGILYHDANDIAKDEFRALQYFTAAANQGYEAAVGYKQRLSAKFSNNLPTGPERRDVLPAKVQETGMNCGTLIGEVYAKKSALQQDVEGLAACLDRSLSFSANGCAEVFSSLQTGMIAFQAATTVLERNCPNQY